MLRQGFAVQKCSAQPIRSDNRCRASSLSLRACLHTSRHRRGAVNSKASAYRDGQQHQPPVSQRDPERRPTVRQARSQSTHSGTCNCQLQLTAAKIHGTYICTWSIGNASSELITTPHLELQIRERSVRQRRRGASCRHGKRGDASCN